MIINYSSSATIEWLDDVKDVSSSLILSSSSLSSSGNETSLSWDTGVTFASFVSVCFIKSSLPLSSVSILLFTCLFVSYLVIWCCVNNINTYNIK